MRRLRLRKRLPRVAKRSPRSSIIWAGSPIGAPRGSGAQTFALLQHSPIRDDNYIRTYSLTDAIVSAAQGGDQPPGMQQEVERLGDGEGHHVGRKQRLDSEALVARSITRMALATTLYGTSPCRS